MLIREVILESFMSYEYARIPLKPGVNVICGPNGAGKSSILLGISVALGQSYTERSKRLSDLIRWGKDLARVTLILDNSRRRGRRPVPTIRKDYILLTRVLRRDGKYWFELDNQAATKGDVLRLLSRFGVDPNNMLIIMHQNMAEQFTVLSPQEKLRMVEAAVGLEPYRRNVLKAKKKLSRILSQEESVKRLLESAEQTLNYWREQYERYQQKKQLLMKRRFLERELAWARVAGKEDALSELKEKIALEEERMERARREAEAVGQRLKEAQEQVRALRSKRRTLLKRLLELERELGRCEAIRLVEERVLGKLQSWADTQRKWVRGCLKELGEHQGLNPTGPADPWTHIQQGLRSLQDSLTLMVNSKGWMFEGLADEAERMERIKAEASTLQGEISRLDSELELLTSRLIDGNVQRALLEHEGRQIAARLKGLNRTLRELTVDLERLTEEAGRLGPRIATTRSPDEILDEIRVTDGHLAALADVFTGVRPFAGFLLCPEHDLVHAGGPAFPVLVAQLEHALGAVIHGVGEVASPAVAGGEVLEDPLAGHQGRPVAVAAAEFQAQQGGAGPAPPGAPAGLVREPAVAAGLALHDVRQAAINRLWRGR